MIIAIAMSPAPAVATESSVGQYGGAGAGGTVAEGGVEPGDEQARECIEEVLATSEGASASEIADRILARCVHGEDVEDGAAASGGLPVTGLDIVFLLGGVLVLTLIGWLISRAVLHESGASR